MSVLVCDVSRWDGDVDIARLRNAGVGAVIVKCGGGDSGLYADSKWERNYANCKATSTPVGAYWYLGATTVARAKEEAAYCLKLLKGKTLEYPVYVDVEEKSHQQMTPSALSEVICAFTDAVRVAGWLPGVYSWKWLLEPCGAKVAALEWWVCAWTKAKPCDCGMWQFGGETNQLRSTTVAGYPNMDQSYAYVDYPSMVRELGLNGFRKETTMTKVSNCSGTEYGGAYGGVAGDQTGREVVVRDWYDFEQIYVYRHPDPRVGEKLAELATDTAMNPHVGYDQNGRLTFRNALRKVNYAPKKIATDVETDCSACTAALIEAVGVLLGIKALADFDTTLSTHGMDAPLRAAGFKRLTASKYLRSGDYLMKGDISLAPGHHVNIAVTNGSKVPKAAPKPVPATFKFKTTTECNIRTYPDALDATAVVGQLAAGKVVNCDGFLVANGTVWAHYLYRKKDRYVSMGQANEWVSIS